MVWLVIWVVLMIFWLVGTGIFVYGTPNPATPAPSFFVFGTNTLIPWACVLILGLIIFGGISVGPVTVGR